MCYKRSGRTKEYNEALRTIVGRRGGEPQGSETSRRRLLLGYSLGRALPASSSPRLGDRKPLSSLAALAVACSSFYGFDWLSARSYLAIPLG